MITLGASDETGEPLQPTDGSESQPAAEGEPAKQEETGAADKPAEADQTGTEAGAEQGENYIIWKKDRLWLL